MKPTKKQHLTDQQIYFRLGSVLLILLIVLAPLYYAGIFTPSKYMPPCLFHTLTGFSCPGCGCTRAVHALAEGRIIESLKFNPIIIVFFLYYIPYMISNVYVRIVNALNPKKEQKKGLQVKDQHIYVVLAILLIFWLIRLIYEISILVH